MSMTRTRRMICDISSEKSGRGDMKRQQIPASTSYSITSNQRTPEILGHLFDTLWTALKLYDDVRKEIRPEHRLADFIIWGEISRALGNRKNEFLEAWMKNVRNQN